MAGMRNGAATRVIEKIARALLSKRACAMSVKSAAERKPSRPVSAAELRGALRGAPSVNVYGSTDGNGSVYVSPMQARRNLYGEVYRQEGRSQEDANAAAEASMDAAQKARWEALKKDGRLPAATPRQRRAGEDPAAFDPIFNYPIYPHKTVVRGAIDPRWKIAPRETVYDRVPIVSVLGEPRSRFFGNYANEGNGVLSMAPDRINLNTGRQAQSVLYSLLHEGIHSFAPVLIRGDDGNTVTSFYGPGGDNARSNPYGSGYASSAGEALVAIATEKARMSARGVDTTQKGLGRLWASRTLASRPPSITDYFKMHGDEINAPERYVATPNGPVLETRMDRINRLRDEWRRTYHSQFDNATNVESLRGILFYLNDRASAPNATPADKRAYEEFLDSLDYYFPLARNGRADASVKTASEA